MSERDTDEVIEQSLALESALWTAVRALEEKQILITRLGEQAQREGRDRSASVFLERAEGLQRQADGLRSLVESVMTVGDAASVSVSGSGSVPS